MLLAIGIGKSTGNKVSITNYLHLVNIKHVDGIVKDIVQIIEELDSLAGRAHGGQLGEPNYITEE